MNKYKGYSKIWFLALLLVAFVAGCGSKDTVALTAYSLDGVTGTINETAKTIAVTMPYGTDVTALVATFTTTGTNVTTRVATLSTTGTDATIGAVAQTSGTTAHDFTNPVLYTVTAADGTTATYNVTVTVALSSAKALTAYSLAGVAGTVNETAKTVAVTMPYGTDVTALLATFMTTGAGVKVGAVAQTSGTTANDFTSPMTYTVIAADSTTAAYTITVNVAQSSAKALTAYSLAGVAGTINETAKTIAVSMPSGTDVAALVATFTTTGAGVPKVGLMDQLSGTTANDFTSPVAYTVTAADSTTATYAVTVSVALSSAKALTAYSLAGVAGTINETAKTIAVSMPSGTDVTVLVATFTTTGAGVPKVGLLDQLSGTTANDFTSPVAYTVTAADRTTASYIVTITVALSSSGPTPVNLGLAGNFVILARAGISTVPTSAVTGDIGVSPIASTAITGFSLIMDGTGTFSTSSQVIGKAYAADYTSPTPSNLTTAVSNMEAAFADAAGRLTPDFTELGAGDISGLTLVPGLYKWGTGVLISTDVTLSGGPNDVWIFQIAGGITQASGASVLLAGGALPKNIFWQTAGVVALSTTAHMEGIVLSQTGITLATGATVNGRLLAQTAVTLDSSTVVQPAP